MVDEDEHDEDELRRLDDDDLSSKLYYGRFIGAVRFIASFVPEHDIIFLVAFSIGVKTIQQTHIKCKYQIRNRS